LRPVVHLRGPAAALFASDMHLGAHDRPTLRYFLSALDRATEGVSHLFLLGDLLEAWVGDDAADAAADELAATLAELTRQGLWIGIQRGNRDFLIDVPIDRCKPFTLRCGAQLLDDPVIIDLMGESVMIAHGDAWCLSDRDYLAFRAQVREASWQSAFLAKPLAERLAIARAMRDESQSRRQITDIDHAHTIGLMRTHGVSRLIHGHTHQPGQSSLETSSNGAGMQRWVLPDWSAAPSRGGFLRVDARGWRWIAAG
jgi:UDP-2,3-diacylglucosamine hydrolase